MIRKFFLGLLGLVFSATFMHAQSVVAIQGGKVLTVTQGVIENGTVLIENGKIAAVGADVQVPAGAKVIDARGKVVIPGLIDSGTRLGLVEIPEEQTTVDSTEYTEPVQPDLRVLDALNPRSELLRVARTEGITNALSTSAEGNLVAGQCAFIRLNGDTVEQLVVKSPAALLINLGEPSKLTYVKKDKPPTTRMGEIALIRQAFLKARHYRAEQEAFAKKQAEGKAEKGPKHKEDWKDAAPPARDLKMEALVAALDGKIPVVVRAERVSDIEVALRLAEEFGFKLVLARATAAWRLAETLGAKKIPVIVGPVQEEPSRMESLDTRLDNAAILHRAGVPIAIQSDADTDVRELPFAVEYAIAHGLPDDVALAAVTINPARFFGLDDRLGSIEAGKQANLVILDGMPFYVKTHVVAEFIDGRQVDLSTHQTELYEFYKKKYGIE
jgi:imidazolonepropionase-like amidohydrolase